MTITVAASASQIGIGLDTDGEVEVEITGIYGDNVVVVCYYGVRAEDGDSNLDSGDIPTLNALGDMERGYSGAGSSYIEGGTRAGNTGLYWLPVGNVKAFTATVNFLAAGTGGTPGRVLGVTVIRGADQTIATLPRGRFNISGSNVSDSTIATSSTHNTDDFLSHMCMNVDHTDDATNDTSDTVVANLNHSDSGNGPEFRFNFGYKLPAGGTQEDVTYSYLPTDCRPAMLVVAFDEETTTAAVILTVDGTVSGSTDIDTADTDIPLVGVDMAQTGTEKWYIGDDPDFDSATLVEQNISLEDDDSANWDDVDITGLSEGTLWGFWVTDDGGGGQAESPPFEMEITSSATGDEEGAAVVGWVI